MTGIAPAGYLPTGYDELDTGTGIWPSTADQRGTFCVSPFGVESIGVAAVDPDFA